VKLNCMIVLGVLMAGLSGCATYTTPGGPADLSGIQSADIKEIMAREAAASFPALATLSRVQAAGYQAMSTETYGGGAFVVVTNDELMGDTEKQRVASLAGVKDLASMNRLLMPSAFGSIDDLRTASAQLKADILFVYTLDTAFRVDGTNIGPMSVISLGFARDRETIVKTTASLMVVDVRSGFIFGTAEATATETLTTSAWGSVTAADKGRVRTERAAFDLLLEELEKLMPEILAKHG